jgi:hypothetical protein
MVARTPGFFLEWKLGPQLRITPNTVVTTYDQNDQGVTPRTNFYLRLTFFINLE